MIRIKAPRIKRRPFDPPGSIHRGRWISEAMYRRVLTLVRACDTFCTEDTTRHGHSLSAIIDAHRALQAQSEREAREAEKEAGT